MYFSPQLTSLTSLLVFIAGIAAVNGHECSAQDEQFRALDGEWLYVEDRTVDRPVEKQGPPMSAKFVLRVEKDAIVHVRSRGNETIKFDGSDTEVVKNGSITRYRGGWKNGVFYYETDVVRDSDKSRVMLLRREFQITPDGLLVKVMSGTPLKVHGVALYQHPNDIALPTPAKAKITDLSWLAGAWIGKKGTRSTEERWTPPLGGAMLGISRTVSRDKMVAFEFLRIAERDGGLVYVAQPGGRTPTEFVLTKLEDSRAVFLNPRHDYPQQIVYERTDEGSLTASIGFAKGGTPRKFEFKREDK